jgi:hypothetical protein
MMNEYYAYVHTRPDNSIFYVGKGHGKRATSLVRSNNAHHTNIVAKYGKDNIGVGILPCSTEKIAFELEIGLLKCLRRTGARLANRTNGGEGPSGLVFSEEVRIKLSKANKGENNPLYGRVGQDAPMSATNMARRGQQHPMIGKGHKVAGEKNGGYGKVGSLNPNYKNRGTASPCYGKKHSPEHIAKTSGVNNHWYGVPVSESRREDIRKALAVFYALRLTFFKETGFKGDKRTVTREQVLSYFEHKEKR